MIPQFLRILAGRTMKICWSNLVGFYLSPVGTLRKGTNTYHELICKYCGEPFLGQKLIQMFCTKSCSMSHRNKIMSGDKHPRWKGGISKAYGLDPEHLRKQRIRYEKKDKEKNPERYRERRRKASSAYWKRNRGKCNALLAGYRARKMNQTPEDADKELIGLKYKLCTQLNRGAGWQAFNVDHIIPLTKGGLHHEDNLQILPAYINRIKSDKLGFFDRDVPEDFGN